MKTQRKYQLLFSLLCTLVLLSLAVAVLQKKVSASGEGQITGTIKLDGTAPHQKPIDMSKEPSCAAIHKDKPITMENVTVGSNGGLQWVAVYISEGLTGNEAASSENPTWDQVGCQYVPHMLALNPGQHFKVVNSDKTSHNIHPQPTKNSEWNKSQPPGSAPFDVNWANAEMAIPVKCNIHPWMHGYMAVAKGPTAVSDGSGSFKMSNVPPGTYTLTAWQEMYGTQTAKVTVAAGQTATADFTFKAK